MNLQVQHILRNLLGMHEDHRKEVDIRPRPQMNKTLPQLGPKEHMQPRMPLGGGAPQGQDYTSTNTVQDYDQNHQPTGRTSQAYGYAPLQMQPAYRSSLGTDDSGYDLQSNPDQRSPQPTYLPQMDQQIQGGVHNRGMIPLQGSRFIPPIQGRYSNWFDY